MQMKLRQLTRAATFAVAAAFLVACEEGVATPSGPDASAGANATQAGQLQPGQVSKSISPCPGGVCDDGGGGGSSGATTYLTGFEDAMPGTPDYYALEFNFKNSAGAQVGTTKEQRWHGNSFYLGQVPGNMVNVGQAMSCGGKVQVEVRRSTAFSTWQAAGNFFISSSQNNVAVTYYDPTRGQWGYVKLAFNGCV